MGYLYICLGVLAGVTKGFFGKKTSDKISEIGESMLVNAIRMFFCIVIGFGIICFEGSLKNLSMNSEVLWIAILSGLSTSAFVVSWLMSVKKSAYMMLDVFLTSGTVIPIAASAIFLGESVEINQLIGLAILFVAVFNMCSYNTSLKGKMSVSSFVNLILCGIFSGISDFSQKLFVNSGSEVPATVFNFYTYVFATIFLALCFVLFFRKGKQKGQESVTNKIKPVVLYILIMSVCLFLNSFFKILAAGHLSAAQLYPLNQWLGMIVSTVMSVILLKERITMKSVIGICLAFLGLFFINVL